LLPTFEKTLILKHILRGSRSGFTLIEIMLVVIIIGILAALVVGNIGGLSTEAKITRAQADISQIRMQIGMFEQRYGHYPKAEEGGLTALLERPSTIPEKDWRVFLEKDPLDPWGNPYIYLADDTRIEKSKPFNIYSMGPNQADDAMTGDDIK
jgi:general secretion pathway protein G